MIRTLASIVDEIEKTGDVSQQAAIMQANSSKALKDIIGYAMDPGVKWLLPHTDPSYKPMPASADQEGRLYTETKQLIYFVDSPAGRKLPSMKREQMFIRILESVDMNDARLLLRIKKKALKISLEAVKKAFPGISKNW